LRNNYSLLPDLQSGGPVAGLQIQPEQILRRKLYNGKTIDILRRSAKIPEKGY
jgi:hypothetical protein